MEWYVIFVKTGEEELVQNWLTMYFNKLILNSIIPKKRICERIKGSMIYTIKKLFPGYVFINTEMNSEVYYKIKSIPTYVKVLGNPYFESISLNEMKLILTLINEDQILECSQIYLEDSKLEVISGPLKGKEAIIKKIDKRKKRAKILINLGKDEKVVDVGVEILGNELK